MPSAYPKTVSVTSRLRVAQVEVNVSPMLDANALFILAVFALAGFVKGVIGLGLPTVSMGLLALSMSPVDAAAILVLPSFLTNIWQMCSGPCLVALARRLWPLLSCVCLGTWLGADLMTEAYARQANLVLGAALAMYALSGLWALYPTVPAAHEAWLGPIVGAATGAITAASGVFVIPAVPYLQALGLEKNELVQALGLSFTVSTVALAVNLAWLGALNGKITGHAIGAVIAAFVGMWLGQILRTRLAAETFRRWFFAAVLLLGVYLAGRAAL